MKTNDPGYHPAGCGARSNPKQAGAGLASSFLLTDGGEILAARKEVVMIQGYIPEKVTYVARGSRDITVSWDESDDMALVSRTVKPCFPIADDSAGTIETARNWAKQYGGKGKAEVTESVRQNAPFSISICSLEVRERGGRAYKVIDDDGYYFDLREDVLLDALLNSSVLKGRIDCNFVWAKIGSQMKLVRVGSALHEAVIEGGKRRGATKVSVSALQPGGVYRNAKGESFLILGWVSTVEYTHTPEVKPSWPGDSTQSSPEKMTETKRPKMLLVLELPEWGLRECAGSVGIWLKKVLSLKENWYTGYFKLQKSLSVIEKTGQEELPCDVLARCSATGIKALGPSTSVNPGNIAYLGWLANIKPTSKKVDLVPEFEPYYARIKHLLGESAN